ncbi:MAG: PfkB family carbohydrate kinase [Treponema sp.]|nr:PfkB family carbohydrate kinase [Treponema sp.]MCL2272572.1 PfkB family carbohydrate kinase [Treponema sp.]
MFLTVCLNPTIQKTLCFSSVTPGSVNRTGVHRLDASGKGINVTRVLTQLGKKAVHLTQLGGVMRPLFLSLCEQDGLSIEWAESNSEIRFCYTVLNESDYSVTELVEESQSVAAETEGRLLEKFNAMSDSHLIISGTKAAGFSDHIIPIMVRKAKEKGAHVILDIKGKDLLESLKYEPDVIKPNLEEFTATFKTEPCKDMMLELSNKYRCRIILTNGSRKILAAEKGNFSEIDISFNAQAANTTGCGDAFTAGLASALDDGADFRAAVNEGIRCGALNAALVRPGVIR